MQIVKLLSVILLIVSSLALARTRNPNSLVDDLKALSGSYKLEKGNPLHCPDGEITASDDKFVLGANLRITGINKKRNLEPAGDGNVCSAESLATFDGKKLIYSLKEKCDKGSASIRTHTFDVYESKNTQYIQLKYLQKSDSPNSHKSSFSYECLYSRDLGK